MALRINTQNDLDEMFDKFATMPDVKKKVRKPEEDAEPKKKTPEPKDKKK